MRHPGPDDIGRTVTSRYAYDHGARGIGQVIGYCGVPQVLIEYPNGTREWWRADMTELKEGD